MGRITTFSDAMVIPADPSTGTGGGVCTANGNFAPDSMIWRDDAPLYPEPAMVDPTGARLAGRHLFGGILSWHFGHYVVESLSRLWPLLDDPAGFDSIVFFPKGRAGPDREPTARHKEVFDLLAPGQRITLLAEPTQVETLVVPEQGFGTGALEAGIPAFRDFIASRKWPEPDPKAPKKVYVTRSGLTRSQKGRLIGDEALARALPDYGFTTIRPEKMSFAEQIALYRGARRLLFDDGSALHVFGLVAGAGQTVGSLQRRFADGPAVGQRQLRAFAGLDLKVVDAVTQEWRPEGLDRPTSKSHGEVDRGHLHEALKGFGAVPGDSTPDTIGLPTPEEAAGQMRALGYKPVERAAPLPQPPAIMTYWGLHVPDGPHLNNRKIRSLRDGFYERQEVLNALDNFRPEDRLLELGAGSGIVGGTVVLNCGIRTALSFEANPALIAPARALYARNELQDRIELRQAILTTGPDAPETIRFGVAADYLGSRILTEGEALDDGMTVADVPAVPLNQVMAEFRPTALMMDIEGGELDILEQGDLSSVEVAVIELHRDLYGGPGMKRCRRALQRAGLEQRPDYCRRGVETWARPGRG